MIGKRLINTGVAAEAGAFTPSEHFETVTYTGNGGTQRIGGYINRGGVFNGSSSKVQIDTTAFNLQDMAVSMWVYSSSWGSNYELWSQRKYVSPTESGWMLRTDTSGYIKLMYTLNGSSYVEVLSSSTLSTNTWHHIAVILDRTNTTSTIYLDGTSVGTGTISSDISYGGAVTGASIGAGFTNYLYFNGKIDQVRVFNKALSSSEVTTLYGETYASSTVSTTDIFDDNSGVALYQLDGNANDTGGVSGKFGSAAIFNGSSSKIEVPSKSFTSSTNWSLSYWINWSTSPTSKQYVYYFGNYNLRIEGQSGLNKIVFWDGSAERIVSNAVSLNNWQHITYTYNGTTLTMYVNGSSVDTLSVTSSPVSTSVQETIGAAYDGSGRFNGKLDDIRIYDDVLTSTEVGYIYNNTTASIPTDNLQAYYKLDGDARDEQQLYDGTATNVTYAYNGTATNVTYQEATKFQPDLVWIKNRSSAQSHRLVDSVRGDYNLLFSDLTNANDGPSSSYPSIESNGFALNSTESNASSTNYVAWCFKGGGTAVSNTDGTITSQVSANQDAGFSIVKYTGQDAVRTIGHGLSSAPEMMIIKNLTDGTRDWAVYHKDIGNTHVLRLNQTDAASSNSVFWNNTSPTSTVFTVGNSSITGSSDNFIAYCFHSVDGYSKIGSYTGTGAAGNSVVTGFQPQFLLIKNTSSGTNNWIIVDEERSTSNPRKLVLEPNTSDAESTETVNINFTSNGFELTNGNSDVNDGSATYIYLAIAADPDTTTPTVENSFDVVTYTGNGTSLDIITDFKPDLVWTKPRSYADNHQLWDTIRGAGWTVYSNSTNAQNPTIRLDGVSSFNDNGFSIGNWNNINVANETYVAWVWKAGDHDDNLPQINTEGSIDSVVSVNAAAGFSIVKWTGNGSTNIETIGHGLSSAPEMVIWKNIDRVQNWHVYNSYGSGSADWGYLNLTDAFGSANNPATMMNQTAPTSTIFTIYNNAGNANTANYSGEDYIAYCFHSVSGYQKIGSYTGNGSTTGPTITLGFQPRFLMVKRTDTTGHSWLIYDSTRSGSNFADDLLYANTNQAENPLTNRFEFLSNGFKILTDNTSHNASGGTYIYLAIA